MVHLSLLVRSQFHFSKCSDVDFLAVLTNLPEVVVKT